MTLLEALLPGLASAGAIGAAMALVALAETVVPLHARGHWGRAHLGPNLALTALALGTNLLLNAALLVALAWLDARGLGLLRAFALPPLACAALAVVALDLATWATHVAMHRSALLWRFHRVHHADPLVDVTTTIRQHPGESAIRYAFLAVAACGLGASPAAFAVYRTWSALQGLLEHANLRVPARLDTALSFLITTPNLHKVHHSRVTAQTDTNYGNLFALFDRAFGSFTPSAHGVAIEYGLDGLDDAGTQTAVGLLALPFRSRRPPGAPQLPPLRRSGQDLVRSR
ncbi:MAG TPA: sterol desaturase family protein [Myxococcota bacterium]|nr:sterol desaturase family protein [Myxococcota bacterium]